MTMEISPAALDAAADAQTVNTLKLHSGPVGASGTTNQIAGASVGATWASATSGYRDLASAVDVPVSAGDTVSHFSAWNGSTFVFGDVLDTAAETYANDGTARITSARLTFAKGA